MENKTWIIGDVHGNIDSYLGTIAYIERQGELIGEGVRSIQVGDMGLFPKRPKFLPYMENHRWIRGNHDDPEMALNHPGNLGDFGVWQGIFYIAGAWSIDKDQRTPMVDWWPNEELNWEQWNKCIDLYTQVKPSIVVSHDCPSSVSYELWKIKCTSNTAKGLQNLLDIHRPDLHIFGHHHKNANKTIGGTDFVCLAELQTYKIK